MAILDCEYHCGCGFRTTESLKALDHVNATSHTITVQGIIKPGSPRAKTTKAERAYAERGMPKPRKTHTTQKPAAPIASTAEEPLINGKPFSDLRQRILNGRGGQK
jgi:hypothetical protein